MSCKCTPWSNSHSCQLKRWYVKKMSKQNIIWLVWEFLNYNQVYVYFSPKSIFNKGRAFGKKMWLDSNEGKQQSKVPTVAGSRAKPPGIEILLLVEMKQEEAWIILYDWPGYCGDREERVSTSDNLEDWMAKKPLRFKAQGPEADWQENY